MQSLIPTMDRYLEYMGVFSILLVSMAQAGCPSKCICSKNKVGCVERSLLNIPNFESLDNDPVIIDISSNDIAFIEHYDLSFDKAEFVMILYLNDSKIIDIDSTAFKELINLKEMYLSENLLSDLPTYTFKYNRNLVYLDLSFNLFINMPKIISNSLKTLNLMNAGIENIDLDKFIDLPNLEFLYLQRNNLRIIQVDMFKYLPKLILVEIQHNAWKCTCETVELFNFLNANRLLNIEEPFQCRTKNDFFITFFDTFGALEPVKNLCLDQAHNASYNFGGDSNGEEDAPPDYHRQHKMENIAKKHNNRRVNTHNSTCEHIEYVSAFQFPVFLIFTTSLLLTFLLGLILGKVIFRFKKNVTNDSSSFKTLLKNDNIV